MSEPTKIPLLVRGRGAMSNPTNRFEKLSVEDDFEHVGEDEEYLASRTRRETDYFVDSSRNIIATNDSPDVEFSHSVNAYRGCAHGCIYCYARPSHEFIGFSAGLDFESRIMVKTDAPQLLREALSKKSWKPVVVHMSGVTDCYQPIERKLELTRGCLQVFHAFSNPTFIITKNHLVTRDIDLLTELAKHNLAGVCLSVTTLDADLARVMEPRTSVPKRRLEAIAKLREAGVPVGVMVAPVIPGLTDHEMPAILKAAGEAGAQFAAYQPVRLPGAVAPLFEEWAGQHFPDRKDKILNRIRELRDGKLNDPNFGSRMRGKGLWADQLKTIFQVAKRRAGIVGSFPTLSTEHFRRPGSQMDLFGQ